MSYIARVSRALDGLVYISTGASRGCSECGLDEDAPDEALEMADEAGLSWEDCDCCGSPLGGNRHPAHGMDQETGELVHLYVCTDCVFYIAYGDVPDEEDEDEDE